MFDRDFWIFLALLVGVLLLNILPLPASLRALFFLFLIVAQVLFIYRGIRRGR